MALYKHIFTGICAAGDGFSYQWHANSIRDIATAHGAAIVWNQTLWNGAVAGNGYKDHVTGLVQMASVKTVQIDVATGKQLALRQTGQIIAGTVVGDCMPADVSLVVSLRTAFPQRSGRGRFYLPQPSNAQVTATGRVAADIINDTNASLAAAWAGYNTGVDRPVIYSPTFRLTRDLVSWDIGDLYDTQRRRENKVTEVRQGGNMP